MSGYEALTWQPEPAGALPLTPGPSPTRGEGRTARRSDAEVKRWNVPPGLRERMEEAARGFRKEPTRSEGMLWRALRGRALDGRKFRRQQPIGPFVVDFFCAAEKLVVEVDGGVHETQMERDRMRQECLEALGLRFIRIASTTVETDLASALTSIRGAFNAPVVLPSPLVGEGPGVRGNTDAQEATV